MLVTVKGNFLLTQALGVALPLLKLFDHITRRISKNWKSNYCLHKLLILMLTDWMTVKLYRFFLIKIWNILFHLQIGHFSVKVDWALFTYTRVLTVTTTRFRFCKIPYNNNNEKIKSIAVHIFALLYLQPDSGIFLSYLWSSYFFPNLKNIWRHTKIYFMPNIGPKTID